ncbi:hypothetical protein ACTQ1R_14795 [Prevotellaceae bacterium LCP21S3_C11]
MTTMKSILSRLTQAVSGTDKELFNEQELNQFASFYLDKWDENTSEDVVAESFVDYWWNTDRACRRCSECGKLMREGHSFVFLMKLLPCLSHCFRSPIVGFYQQWTLVILHNLDPD